MRLIVADASPLIVIAKSGLIPVLKDITEEVIIPETDYAECTVGVTQPGARAIRAAVEVGHIRVKPDADPPCGEADDKMPVLDAGERAAIALAHALQCPILIDERLGRQAARRKGLAVIGSAGLLLEARQRRLISAVAPILDQWQRSGYFLSTSVVKAVLDKAG